MDKFQNTYRIPSARAGWHDYNGLPSALPVCNAISAKYAREKCTTPKLGNAPADNLANVSAHYPYAHIPLFVVMPNLSMPLCTLMGMRGIVRRMRKIMGGIVQALRATSLQQRQK